MRTLGLVLAVVAVGCGGSADLCSRLQSEGSGCDRAKTKERCEAAIKTAKADKPECAPMVEALASCIAPLKLSCLSSDSISANSDGMFEGGRNFIDVGGFSVIVGDVNCSRYRRGLAACRECPEAAGAKDPEALGVGDKCPGVGGSCATGLTCQSGICTRACTSDDDCLARADDCKLRVQFPNVCRSGKCTLGCSGDSLCSVEVASGSTCQQNGCTLP